MVSLTCEVACVIVYIIYVVAVAFRGSSLAIYVKTMSKIR